MTSIPAAINTLKLFGDNATAGGLFKSVADAIIFKEALETVVTAINERNAKIAQLEKDYSERTMP